MKCYFTARRNQKGLLGSLIVAVVWAGGAIGWGQTDQIPVPLLPQNLNGTFQPVGARALGMGGAFVSVANDSTASAWNPAGVTQLGGFDLSLGLNLGSEALSVNDLEDLVDGLKDAVGEGSDKQFFDSIQRYARDRQGQITYLQASPVLGLGVGQSISISAFGHSQGGILLRNVDANTTSFQGGALAIGYGAVTYAFSANRQTRVGVSVKAVQAFYHPYAFDILYDPATQDVTDTSDSDLPFNADSDDSALTADVGLIRQRPGAKMGLVLRNLTSPRLRFDNPNRQRPGQPEQISLELEPEIDFGHSWYDRDEIASIEMHNLTISNDQPVTFHFGYERRINDWLALRTGINNQEWVGGLGLNLGPISIDATVGPSATQAIAIGGRLEF